MQHVGKPNAVSRFKLDGDGRQQIGLAQQRLVARKPARRSRQAISINVEKGKLLEPSRISPVDEEAGANPCLQMAGGEVVTVEIEQPLRGTAPSETIGEAMDQAVVEGEHERRVNRVRRLDCCGVRCPDIPWSLSGHGWTI